MCEICGQPFRVPECIRLVGIPIDIGYLSDLPEYGLQHPIFAHGDCGRKFEEMRQRPVVHYGVTPFDLTYKPNALYVKRAHKVELPREVRSSIERKELQHG